MNEMMAKNFIVVAREKKKFLSTFEPSQQTFR